MISIKSAQEIEKMKKAGSILNQIIEKVKESLREGVTTQEIDSLSEELITSHRCKPAFKGYRGFPASTCISVNEEVIHGIPGGRVIKQGDIVSVDIGVEREGYFADAAITQPIGMLNGKLKKLVDVTRESLYKGINKAVQGNYLSDISSAIQNHVEANGFSVVRDFVGHGIGTSMHEEPEVPNFGRPHSGPQLQEGMTLAIEPMVNMGTYEVEILDNGWTAITRDRAFSAHFEHTIAITKDKPIILTQ
ncbi:type I methionyl aminopeptidase [Candidatus Omnitrophota bacterium]